MCPRKRGLLNQEGRDGGCKGFGGTARDELAEHALTTQTSGQIACSAMPSAITKALPLLRGGRRFGSFALSFPYSSLTQSPQLSAGTHNWASTGFEAPCASEK